MAEIFFFFSFHLVNFNCPRCSKTTPRNHNALKTVHFHDILQKSGPRGCRFGGAEASFKLGNHVLLCSSDQVGI